MNENENKNKLLKILKEIFQLDRSDLDFGIYRIMNTKSEEIKNFLDEDLLSSVANAFHANKSDSIKKKLDEAIGQAESLEVDPETLPKVKELREKLASTSTPTMLENDVFSHLIDFFRRYYKDGDFLSLRRYKKDVYAIPYEGEEVKLHWANSDQYYIKSGEYFRDYTFTAGSKTIHLKLSAAEEDSDNNKAANGKERRFVLLESEEKKPCEIIDNQLYINFEYKAIGKEKQEMLNQQARAKVLESIEAVEFISVLNTPMPTEKNGSRTIFEKHVTSYTSRNSFDYFIHKDLGRFLCRELDFYIKNEMLFLDDIMHSPVMYEEVMSKIKIFREVSKKIIAFLTELEELQKKLWEKKKFVIETNYCITLGKIDEKYYAEILKCKKQLAEWKTLFDADIKSVDELKEEKYLVLDTKFFDMKFKYKLLSEFDNIDEEINGVLINSENFGALNLLQRRYKGQIKTIYIDPPYNTGKDGFLYKDNLQHSSWMSFMYDRLALGRELMSDNGNSFTSMDDNEIDKLKLLQHRVFGDDNYLGQWNWFKSATPPNLSLKIKKNIEYVLGYEKVKDSTKYRGVQKISSSDDPFTKPQNTLKKLIFPPMSINCKFKNTKIIAGVYGTTKYPNTLLNDMFVVDGKNTNEVIFENKFIWTQNKLDEELDNMTTINCSKNIVISYKKSNYDLEVPPNFIDESVGVSTTEQAGNNLIDIFNREVFKYPKSVSLIQYLLQYKASSNMVIDYFAGSGTTGHAVINLNREDGGKRKYILVEMGEYFDSVMKARIQKVIYSDGWKDGKPITKNGISQIFKYFKLESYEDTLNNLTFKRTKEQEQTLFDYPKVKEDYILNYSLDVESQSSLLNIDAFSNPFNYKLKIATSSVGETKDTAIDLVETFNYLLGLVVKRMELLNGYLVVEGRNLKGEKILIIWGDEKSSDELTAFFEKMDWSVYDREFDIIYVNGDNSLANLGKDEKQLKVKLIEEEFKQLMFNGEGI